MANDELSHTQTVLPELCAHVATMFCGICDERLKPGQHICYVELPENTCDMLELSVWRDCYQGNDPADHECKYFGQERSYRPEYPLVHKSCFPLFSKFSDSDSINERLWAYALSLSTIFYRVSPLKPPKFTVSLPEKTYCDSLSLGGLSRSSTSQHLARRWFRWMALLEYLKDQAWSPSRPGKTSYHPSSILRWERHADTEVITTKNKNQDNFVLLIYDDRGLSSITQYGQIPEIVGAQSAEDLYMLCRVQDLTDMKVHFNYGFAHIDSFNLTFTKGLPFITPESKKGSLQPIFDCIQTRYCTGITVIFVMGRPMTFHAHSPHSPKALTSWTKNGLDENCITKHHVWIYIPFTSGDRITHFGVAGTDSRPQKLLFNFEKSGLHELGAGSQPKDNWTIQSVNDWPDFAFKMPDWQSLSPTEHIYLVSPGDNTDCLIDHLQGSEVDPQCFESTAPLGDVSSATVYQCAGFCQGIHFIYEDSRQRTVGQCRLGMDQPVIYEKPLRLLWTCRDDEDEYQQHLTGLEVKFSMKDEDEEGKEDKEDGEGGQRWKSRAMEGRVIFRMRRGIADLSFTD